MQKCLQFFDIKANIQNFLKEALKKRKEKQFWEIENINIWRGFFFLSQWYPLIHILDKTKLGYDLLKLSEKISPLIPLDDLYGK